MVQSLQEGLNAFFGYVPQLIGAILILIVGYIVAKLLQAVVTRLLGANHRVGEVEESAGGDGGPGKQQPGEGQGQ